MKMEISWKALVKGSDMKYSIERVTAALIITPSTTSLKETLLLFIAKSNPSVPKSIGIDAV